LLIRRASSNVATHVDSGFSAAQSRVFRSSSAARHVIDLVYKLHLQVRPHILQILRLREGLRRLLMGLHHHVLQIIVI